MEKTVSGQHTSLAIIPAICIVLCLGCTQAPPSPAPATTSSSSELPSAANVEIEIDAPTETEPVAWAATLAPSSITAGDKALLVVRAKIAEGWHIYAAEGSTGVGRPTKFQLTLPAGFTAAEQWELPQAEVKSTALGEVSHYKKTATFAVPIQLSADASGAAEILCEISFQSCTDKSCLPPTSTQLSIPVAVAE